MNTNSYSVQRNGFHLFQWCFSLVLQKSYSNYLKRLCACKVLLSFSSSIPWKRETFHFINENRECLNVQWLILTVNRLNIVELVYNYCLWLGSNCASVNTLPIIKHQLTRKSSNKTSNMKFLLQLLFSEQKKTFHFIEQLNQSDESIYCKTSESRVVYDKFFCQMLKTTHAFFNHNSSWFSMLNHF